MKKLLNSSIIAITAILLTLALASCSLSGNPGFAAIGLPAQAQEARPVNAFSIVIQATRNSVNPDVYIRLKEVADLISSWATPNSSCIFISVSGEPLVLDTFTIPESDALDQAQADDDRAYWADKISGIASEVKATAPEVDTLSALVKAGNWLRDKKADNKYLLYIGSGIATQNDLFSFVDPGLIITDPEKTIGQLSERDALPYLDGVTVWFVGLGCTEQPQEPVGTNMTKLRVLYMALVTGSNGRFEQLYADLGGKGSESEFYVTPVTFPAVTTLEFDPAVIIEQDAFLTPQIITEEKVRFIPDSDQYADPEAALSVIAPIADYMKATPCFRMLLIGTTAGDENSQAARILSEDRAKAVKDTLVSLGVPEGNILTLGLGSADPWHIYGVGTSGAEAAQNRKVVLISADSPDAVDLLALME